MEVYKVNRCKTCGVEIKTKEVQKALESKLCRECKLLHESSEHLISRSPKKAVYFFMDMFMRSRKHTLADDKLKNCIWDAWWIGQKKQLPT
jgi:hypothetical protein